MRIMGWISGVVMVALLVGCASPARRKDDVSHRMSRFQPVTEGLRLGDRVVADSDVGLQPSMEVEDSDRDIIDAQPLSQEDTTVLQQLRLLSRGDRLKVSLRGIPRPEEINNVVDEQGEITLPFIGQVRVAGMSPSDAERLIEETYVQRGIYRSINVIVVAEDKVYFVQGEVARQGKFSMSGDVTLLQAITEAGGYTPFANRRNVKVIRGEEVLFFNARDIANGRAPDPVLSADDIIVVLRSVF